MAFDPSIVPDILGAGALLYLAYKSWKGGGPPTIVVPPQSGASSSLNYTSSEIPQLEPPKSDEVEILYKSEPEESWQFYSRRPNGHPDIAIYSKSKRFNVRYPDGSLARPE